jgi:Flp pilus assembly protein TadG
MNKLIKNFLFNEDKGATAVELAIILPLVLILIFGIIEFGLLLYNKNIITHATREGARVGVVYSQPRITFSQIQNEVNQYIEDKLISFSSSNNSTVRTFLDESSGFDLTNTLNLTCPTQPGSNAKLKVLVNYEYTFLFLPIASIGVGSDATMVCE